MIRFPSLDNPLRILLIEDSRGDALLIEKALERARPGVNRVETATTLAEALALLSEKEFDIALLDRSLPDVEGFSGLHSIQSLSPELPIVFLTAYRDENTALEAIEQGAQDYLFKDKIDGHVIKRAIQYAILRKQFEGVLIVRANFDMLTGLTNRTLFENRLDMALARMKRQGGNLAVLFLDLDRFKEVNDSFGHLTGDKLLKEVAERLKHVLRPYDTAARFGGDEFAVLMEGMPEIRHSEVLAQKILGLFDEPFLVQGREINVGASLGIATCSSGQNGQREMLMQQADAAMYEAKTVPESAFRVFSGAATQRRKA
jgi:diguanylate cyclase (GGDEF)-like protein